MYRRILLFTMVAMMVALASAQAQGRRTSSTSAYYPQHKVEIIPFWGYSWTFSRDVYYGALRGNADIRSTDLWGIALDVNVRPDFQFEALYSRQDTDLVYKEGGLIKDQIPLAVEYWHAGGVGGIQQGKLRPFGSLTLGATRYNFKDSIYSDEWRFSMILGGGVKVYLNERLGLRGMARLPFTFMSGGFGLGCGPSGCYTTAGGSGIAQFDLSLGLMILL